MKIFRSKGCRSLTIRCRLLYEKLDSKWNRPRPPGLICTVPLSGLDLVPLTEMRKIYNNRRCGRDYRVADGSVYSSSSSGSSLSLLTLFTLLNFTYTNKIGTAPSWSRGYGQHHGKLRCLIRVRTTWDGALPYDITTRQELRNVSTRRSQCVLFAPRRRRSSLVQRQATTVAASGHCMCCLLLLVVCWHFHHNLQHITSNQYSQSRSFFSWIIYIKH